MPAKKEMKIPKGKQKPASELIKDYKLAKFEKEIAEDKDPRQVFAPYDEFVDLKAKTRMLANLEAEQSSIVYDLVNDINKLKKDIVIIWAMFAVCICFVIVWVKLCL